MRQIVALLALIVLSVPARADVVRIDRDGGGRILFRTGVFVERAACEDGATTRRRTTCVTEPHRLEAVALYEFVLAAVGKDLPRVDKAMGETQANLAETDFKLREFLAADPATPDDARDLEEIRQAESRAAELETSVQALEEQIARIKARPDYRSNPDLPRQLATLEGELTTARQARDQALAHLNRLRAAYVSARSAGYSQAAFRLLLSQRDAQASQYDQLSAQSKEILAALVEMNQFFNELLEDQSFAYEIRPGAPFEAEAARVLGLFDDAAKRSGVIYGTMTERGIELVIPHMTATDSRGRSTDYASELKWLRCSFRPFVRNCEYLSTMNLSLGDDRRTPVWNLPLKFDLTLASPTADLLDFARQVDGIDSSGNWVFTPACNMTVIDRRNLGQGWCEAGFAYVPDNF